MQVGELFVVMDLDMSQYDAAMKQAEKKANTLGSILENALSFTLGMGLFEAIKQGFKAVVGEAVNFNSMMEQARIGFATMLGSAEAAQAFLNEMANFAKDTPFEFPELLEAAKNMMAMGFSANEVLPTLKAVGDAAAGLGVGSEGIQRIIRALTQMRAKSKVSAEEMLQLAEVGVPAWEILAEHMGTTTAETMKLAERGLIPANEAIQALIDGMEKRFPNMMAKMQNTWQGITSAIRDIWRMTIGSVTEELFKSITAWLGRIRDAATNFYNVFSMMKQQGVDTATALKTAISYAFGESIGAAASMIINAVQGIWQVLVRAAVIIRTYWDSVRYVLLTVLSALFMFKVALPTINWFITLTRILNGTITETSGLFGFLSRAVAIYRNQLITADLVGTVAITTLTKIRYAIYALYTALGKLGIILIVVSVFLSFIISLWSKYVQSVEKANMEKMNQKIRESLVKLEAGFTDLDTASEEASKGAGDFGKSISKASKKARGGLASFDEIHQIMNNIAESAGDLPAVKAPSIPSIPKPSIPKIDIGEMLDFEFEKPTLGGFLKWVWDEYVVKPWKRITNWVKKLKIWENVKKAWGDFTEWAGDMWKSVKKKWNGFVEWVKSWEIWDKIKQKWEAFKNWAGDLWENVKEKWGNFTGWVSETWTNLKNDTTMKWEEIKNKIIEKWNDVKAKLPTWEEIKNTIINKWNDVKTKLPTWDEIKNNIIQKWNDIKAKIPTWDEMKNSIIQKWNDVKTKLPTWDEIKNSIITKWNDIKAKIPTWDEIKNSIIQKWNDIRANLPTWDTIKNSIVGKWNEIKAYLPSWEDIRGTISDKTTSIKNSVLSAWETVKSRLNSIWYSISSTASSIWKGIGNAVIRFVNGIIDAINGMIRGLNKIKISFPSWVPLLGGKTLGFNLQTIGHIPYLAEGGIVRLPRWP